MTRVVIDAAVGLKWVIAEAGSPRACALRVHSLLAPDSILLDWAEALRAKERRGEISQQEALERLDTLTRSPVALTPLRSLTPRACSLAQDLDASVRGCLYLALAITEECQLITADREFVESVDASRWSGAAVFLGSEQQQPSR